MPGRNWMRSGAERVDNFIETKVWCFLRSILLKRASSNCICLFKLPFFLSGEWLLKCWVSSMWRLHSFSQDTHDVLTVIQYGVFLFRDELDKVQNGPLFLKASTSAAQRYPFVFDEFAATKHSSAFIGGTKVSVSHSFYCLTFRLQHNSNLYFFKRNLLKLKASFFIIDWRWFKAKLIFLSDPALIYFVIKVFLLIDPSSRISHKEIIQTIWWSKHPTNWSETTSRNQCGRQYQQSRWREHYSFLIFMRLWCEISFLVMKTYLTY